MLENVLKTIGLSPKEIKVYETLLQGGKSTPAQLLQKVNLKRGDLYNVLKKLEKKQLIYHLPEEKKLTYVPSPPEKAEQMLKHLERSVELAKSGLPLLYSLYNLGVGKPGIRFFQGIEGIKEVFNDSLTAKTEILAYSDNDGLLRTIKKYAIWYAAERRRRKIWERAIVPDTPVAKAYIASYDMAVTRIKFVPHETFKFSLEMNIYDNKVFYVTFREPYIAVIIEDQAVADTQRAIFELSWMAADYAYGKKKGEEDKLSPYTTTRKE